MTHGTPYQYASFWRPPESVAIDARLGRGRGEREVAERLAELDARAGADARVTEHGRRARVGGEDDGLVQAREPRRRCGAAARAGRSPRGGRSPRRSSRARCGGGTRSRAIGAKRSVASAITSPTTSALPRTPSGPERRRRPLVGAEEQVGQPVDLDPRPLLGHREVAAAQPRLDVGDRMPAAAAAAGAGEGRVGVAEDEDGVGPLGRDDLLQRRGQGVDVRGAQVEAVRRLGEPELVEEDGGQLVVPVLPGVDDDLVEPGVAQGDGERRRLDELRPVADDGQDLHARSVVTTPVEHGRLGILSTWPTPTSRPSRRTSITPTTCLDRLRGRRRARGRRHRQRGRRARARGVGGSAAADVRGRRAGPLLRPARPRVDAATALRGPPLGARRGRASRSSSTGRRPRPGRSTSRRRRPARRHAPAPLPDRRAGGCSTSATSGSTARARWRAATSCSTSSSAAGRRTCATSSRRSRPTSTGSSPAPRSRRSSCRAGREPARPRSGSTAPPTCSTPTRDRLRRVLVVGPNPTFMEYVSHVLPVARRGARRAARGDRARRRARRDASSTRRRPRG